MKVPIEEEYRQLYHEYVEEVFDSNFLTEGKYVKQFEKEFINFQGIPSLSFNGWASAMDSVLSFIDIRGYDVVVPSNTFMATPLSVLKNGGNVIFADCNKSDLCLSVDDLSRRITDKTKAVIVVHIGGHISFEIEKIAKFCKERDIFLVEDCAHAHGASFKGKSPGSFGIAGIYSFYATKTIPLGEGGMLVSNNKDLMDFAVRWRNYGKPEYTVSGSNGRMNEITAALGVVQMKRAPAIMKFKKGLASKYDQIFSDKVELPEGMVSGYYKYIVFNQEVKQQTGFVYNDPCHNIMGHEVELPNTDWVSKNHMCPPIWYGWEDHEKDIDELRELLI